MSSSPAYNQLLHQSPLRPPNLFRRYSLGSLGQSTRKSRVYECRFLYLSQYALLASFRAHATNWFSQPPIIDILRLARLKRVSPMECLSSLFQTAWRNTSYATRSSSPPDRNTARGSVSVVANRQVRNCPYAVGRMRSRVAQKGSLTG